MTSDATSHDVHIIGGGLAGSEAAWQLAQRGVKVRLSEMRGSGDMTPAHQTDDKRDQEQNDKEEEKYLGNAGGAGGNTTESEHCRNDGDDKEGQR